LPWLGILRAGQMRPVVRWRQDTRPITTASSAESLLKALGVEIGLGRAIEVQEGEQR
jgi:hypothetical protein